MFKKALFNAIPSGIAGAILSFAAAMFLIPFPETAIENAINNGISGLLSGLVGSLVALVIYMKKSEKN
ncbi:MAG: hypothetical protein IJE28_07765 [Oscillospiraceae bacterium]|nr:hypothetical protein [Oscillospiraceae bacterium]MBQ2899629.1 hypothetical protein [Oscillospiraceae bacterium]MBQ3500501.1 hypothetical protein [Oscillospiraceae bacterium]MBQ7937193.1 hypothetical protein [Oscillospiraceae bacterium]MBR3962006.1 hypothetical protein [Oscillospiraceae bacterium]